MSVKSLGYVVIEAINPSEWDRFLTRVAGVMRIDDAADGAALYRIDDRVFRFRIEKGTIDRLAVSGLEVESADKLTALRERIDAAGFKVTDLSADTLRGRGVDAGFATADPAGNAIEFYAGNAVADTPFVSPLGVPYFIAGDVGMGHAVLNAPNFDECVAFYCDIVGMGQSDMPRFFFGGGDDDAGMGFAFLHGSSGRHHSVALGEGPVPPSACVHLMLELPNLVEVGKAHDRMRAEGFHESATLGQHVNDAMTSFYVRTPAGFDMEIGFEGMMIDPSSWQTTRHEAISVWGHRWSWQDAAAKAVG